MQTMASAKDILIKPIKAAAAKAIVKKIHYSGKTVNNSQLHLGVFINGNLEGAMQFGPSLDKRKIQGLVANTPWNGFLELNRMAFSEALPRNSESRAISIAMKMIRKHYPHIEWIVSFADGAQCGDGTIYRASGFVLTGIKKNNQMWKAPNGDVFARISLTNGKNVFKAGGGASMKAYIEAGFKPIPGFQLRYIYFLNPEARQRLTVPILPFSKIEEMGAGMYKGRPKKHEPGDHPGSGRGGTDPDAPILEESDVTTHAESAAYPD